MQVKNGKKITQVTQLLKATQDSQSRHAQTNTLLHKPTRKLSVINIRYFGTRNTEHSICLLCNVDQNWNKIIWSGQVFHTLHKDHENITLTTVCRKPQQTAFRRRLEDHYIQVYACIWHRSHAIAVSAEGRNRTTGDV